MRASARASPRSVLSPSPRRAVDGPYFKANNMAMNVGSAGSGDPDVIMDINTTPLIDVMLVLLVMLIITIPIQLHSVNLNMPVGNPPPPLVEPEVLKIDVDPASRLYWNGDLIDSRATLEERLKEAAS